MFVSQSLSHPTVKALWRLVCSLYRKTSIKRRVPNNRRVSNKRPGLLEMQAYISYVISTPSTQC